MISNADIILDCYGLLCPMPIIKITEKMKSLEPGKVLEVVATDEGIRSDLPAWCKITGHEFLGIEEKDGEFRAYVRKKGGL
jgi:tRNA 2-thiouridine synthesizing protein A